MQLSKKDQQLLETYNNTKMDFQKGKSIIDVFAQQVEKTPNAISVIFEEKELSFKQIDDLSNKFAHYLANTYSVSNHDLIGLMIDRSEFLIISILGILKVGAAYVPISIDYPEKRKAFIIKDSNCKVTIDTDVLRDFQSQEQHLPDTPLSSLISHEDLAYIIYTSGTTGNPKGVMIEQQSVINLITAQTELYGIDHTEKILQFSNYYFDASVEQIFLALFNGATLAIIGKGALKNHELPSFINNHQITHLNATPSYLETLPSLSHLKSVKRVVAGGEASSIKLAKRFIEFCDFFNAYGPTENTVTSTLYKYVDEGTNQQSLSIGKPIGNVKAYIVSSNLNLIPLGEAGELCLSGEGLARGYLNLPELTNEKFIDNPFLKGEKLYRTGDLAKWRPDGTIAFLGRIDDQVKIRGYRIELGEIETYLNALPSVERGVVVASTHFGQNPVLVAYLQSSITEKNIDTLKAQLGEQLPDYMIPSIYMWVDKFPLTPNGKVDKKSLPTPKYVRPESAPLLKRARNSKEDLMVEVWQSVLNIPNIGINDNFFEMGGSSILTQKLSASLSKEFDTTIAVTKIYQFPTIAKLSEHLGFFEKQTTKSNIVRNSKKNSTADIAIIGMAGRFPGAESIKELWEVLKNGKETISFFTPEELDKSIPENIRNAQNYVAARGIVPSAKAFDARFFGINPKLASAMDPQQRLFLEIAWEVLEQTGHLPKHFDGSVGVYAGTGTNTYYINNVLPNKELVQQVGSVQANTVNDKDYIATRTAYHLNLKGPAVSVHSACSTSLLAIAEAVEAIRTGQCDVALAGGSSVTAPMNSGHLYQEGSMLSANGRCRTFDAKGTGTMFCDGAGVVLLKSLDEAEKDNDQIYAVIKGIGLNNDGGDKGSFTAPSIEGQSNAISKALIDANVNPNEISYVEAHGTATPLGDPIEMEGLHKAFGDTKKKGFCAIGSIKSNMGHLTAAAGVAGVIKTALSMRHNKIPASLGFEVPNPKIDFDNSPFYVNNTLTDWITDQPKKAGISSFGVGGTNVHIVLEEYRKKDTSKSISTKPAQLLTWSSKSSASQELYKKSLGYYLKETNDSLSDVSFTLQTTRDVFKHRSFMVTSDKKSAAEKILSEKSIHIKSKELKVLPNDLIFMFPGQGSQFLQMGLDLYTHEPVFKDSIDACADFILEEFDFDLRTIIYPNNHSDDAVNTLKDTRYTQPAIFAIEFALAQLWMSWGIQPNILTGHSIGEFVAAHLAGIFDLEDALRLITRRGKLVSELPGGSMLSIRASAAEVKKSLPDTLSMAAINSDNLCVVSGTEHDIREYIEMLKEENIPSIFLATSHAFHSYMMNPVLSTFEDEVKKINLKIPRIPIISTVTGKWLKDEEATDPLYWVNHLRDTVQFSDALDTMIALGNPILLEVGPGKALTTLAYQKKESKKLTAIPSLPIPKRNENAYHTVLHATGELWLNGIEPNWKDCYEIDKMRKVSLPSYAFDKKPCWVEPPMIENNTYNNIQTTASNTVINNVTAPLPEVKKTVMRKTIILKEIEEIISDTSGIDLESSEYDLSFLELGLDSLVLTQMAIACKNKFDVAVTFRQLNDQYGSANLLADHLDETLPADKFAPEATESIPPAANTVNNTHQHNNSVIQQTVMPSANYSDQNSALNLIAQQLQLLGQQINLLQGGNSSTTSIPIVGQNDVHTPAKSPLKKTENSVSKDDRTEAEKKEHKKPFGASPRIEKNAAEMDSKQKQFLDQLILSYNKKTAKSKASSQEHRSYMADPRVVTGFKPMTKEMVYPLVIEKSAGNRLWDIDGNEYIDALNGFGSCLFGHQPDFIKDVLHKQIDLGFEVGPQHPLAGEVCKLLCELTNHERAALCNTGSEAVLGAIRIARTVTGRSLIVAFTGSYHGINDEALVRGSKKHKTFPAAAGILPSSVQNVLVLDYGTEESLRIIKERAHEIAAVIVEPVQSRRPEFQPVEFLKEVRAITKESETVFIWDEIITGFRMHLGGTQALFDIRADIATYGKVIGGGISIGAILGDAKYMDALDGGYWQYGDQSFPEVGVTYFAGTFVRHPLALASCKASLEFMKEKGSALQDRLNNMVKNFAFDLNIEFSKRKLPMVINYFGSLWRVKFLEDIPYAELFFVLMREKGIHIWDGFPCFLTDAYNDDDLAKIKKTILECIDQLITADILPASDKPTENKVRTNSKSLNTPPVPGAKLGLDDEGNPAWFIPDMKNEGDFLKIDL
ncbi:amino acid adenylation domain-containing protein [Spongiivirga sp. MCCC 1A20706]|uniref:amino acid adenylation domain-containing protein n=1 Tax=Spongiivirga sp. MCCC 1A20706 TaxID=3160963 RepID=UPI0039773AF5